MLKMKMFWNDIELFFYDWYLRHIKKPKCFICGRISTLQNYDGSWICDYHAEVMNEMGLERESREEQLND